MRELKRLAASSAALVVARVSGMLAGVIGLVILTRALEVADLATILLCMSIAAILSPFVTLNLESVTLRHVVKAREEGRPERIAGFYALALGASTGFGLLTLVIATLDALFVGADLFWWFFSHGVFAAPLYALVRHSAEYTSSLGHVLWGLAPRTFVRPALFALTLALIDAATGGLTLSGALIAFHVTLAAIAIVQVAWIMPRRLGALAPTRLLRGPRDASAWRSWATGGLHQLLPHLFIEYSTDLVLVTAAVVLDDPATAALGILLRVVSLARFAVVAVNQALAPKFATAWARGELGRLDMLLAVSGAAAVATQAAAIVVLALWGERVLSWFEPSFGDHRAELVTLATMGLASAVYGPTARMAAILDMRGDMTRIYVIALGATLLAVPAGGAALGLHGVATAVAVVWVGWNFALQRRIRLAAGVDVSAVGAMRSWLARRRAEAATAA